MSLINIVKSVGLVGIVLSPLACGAIEQYRLQSRLDEELKRTVVTEKNVRIEYRKEKDGITKDIVIVDTLTKRQYRLVRQDGRGKLDLENVFDYQDASRPYYMKDGW